jgi:phosphoenolpyruvate carboxylase
VQPLHHRDGARRHALRHADALTEAGTVLATRGCIVEDNGASDPLRDDIRLLGRLLGETISEQAGAETLARIEAIRRTAMRFRRQQEVEARSELEAMLAALDDECCLLSVHAATLFAQLSNIAEDQHLKRQARADRLAGRPAGRAASSARWRACELPASTAPRWRRSSPRRG